MGSISTSVYTSELILCSTISTTVLAEKRWKFNYVQRTETRPGVYFSQFYTPWSENQNNTPYLPFSEIKISSSLDFRWVNATVESRRNVKVVADPKRYWVNREVNLDVYGKRQTAKLKLLPSVFSSLYCGIKIFVFAVNSKRHLTIVVWFI